MDHWEEKGYLKFVKTGRNIWMGETKNCVGFYLARSLREIRNKEEHSKVLKHWKLERISTNVSTFRNRNEGIKSKIKQHLLQQPTSKYVFSGMMLSTTSVSITSLFAAVTGGYNRNLETKSWNGKIWRS